MLRPAVDELFVNFIGKHDKVVLLCDLREFFECCTALHAAGRVAGAVDDEHARFLRDLVLDLRGVDLIAVLLVQTVGHRHGTEEVRDVDVVEPDRVRYKDLVARIGKGGDCSVCPLADTEGDEGLLRHIVDIRISAQACGNGCAQLGRAVVRGVEHASRCKAVIGSLLDDLGCIEVGAADLHVDHVLSFLLHVVRPLHHDADLGEGQLLHAV